MRPFFGSLAALSLMFATPLIAAVHEAAFAQDQQADASAVKQVPLAARQIEGFIAAQKPVAAIMDKLSEADAEHPGAKVVAELDSVAKANKFANYAEFQTVADNIGLVMAGIDPQKKKYVGAEAVIKQQIGDIDADKSISAKDKKEQIDGLSDQLKSVEPVKIESNIDLVQKYYDKLVAAMPQDSQ